MWRLQGCPCPPWSNLVHPAENSTLSVVLITCGIGRLTACLEDDDRTRALIHDSGLWSVAKVLDRSSCLTCVPEASLVRRCPPTRARMVELIYCPLVTCRRAFFKRFRDFKSTSLVGHGATCTASSCPCERANCCGTPAWALSQLWQQNTILSRICS